MCIVINVVGNSVPVLVPISNIPYPLATKIVRTAELAKERPHTAWVEPEVPQHLGLVSIAGYTGMGDMLAQGTSLSYTRAARNNRLSSYGRPTS